MLELFIDAVVATPTGADDVLLADRGFGVGVRQLLVGGVAVGARGGNGEPARKQPFAVNALGVVFDDLLLRTEIAHGGRRPLAVATRAQVRHIAAEGAGFAHHRLDRR